MNFENFLACLTVLLLLSGCASITRGLSEPVNFETTPKGATVEMESGEVCLQTPCLINVKRHTTGVATIKKDGCESITVSVGNRFSSTGSWMLGGNIVIAIMSLFLISEFHKGEIISPAVDLILASAIGVGIDLYTGAAREVYPNPVKVDLDCS